MIVKRMNRSTLMVVIVRSETPQAEKDTVFLVLNSELFVNIFAI